MKKEDILEASRRENQNRDLAELEVIHRAGSLASRVGAMVCCVLSLLPSLIAHTPVYSPWVIYFSMMGTSWLVRAVRMKKKSDGVVGGMFIMLAVLAFVGFLRRLFEGVA